MKGLLPVDTAVRIIDEAMKAIYFGFQGHIVDHAEGHIKVQSYKGQSVWVRPEQTINTAGLKKARALKGLPSLTDCNRRHLLYEAGYGQETESDYQEFLADVAKAGPVRLWNGHIALLEAHLVWALEVEGTEVQLLHPTPILGWIEGCGGEGDVEESWQRVAEGPGDGSQPVQ